VTPSFSLDNGREWAISREVKSNATWSDCVWWPLEDAPCVVPALMAVEAKACYSYWLRSIFFSR
jgi:hypothetical protein